MNLSLVESVDGENPVIGDLRLTDNQLTWITGREAVRQHLANRLRFFFAEWFLDRRRGFPFYQRVLVKNPNRPVVRSLFRRTIAQTPGIAGVNSLQLTIGSDRRARVGFSAALDEGGDPLVFSDFILGEF